MQPAQLQGTLVDSGVLIDVLADDPTWADWSLEQLDRCGSQAPLIINPLILAELSPRFERAADLEAALAQLPLKRQSLPWWVVCSCSPVMPPATTVISPSWRWSRPDE